MEKIIWTDEFNIGVPEIDRQHRQLIQMVNRLLTTADVTTDSEIISDILTDMTRYAQEHFRMEEKLLEDSGYPDLESHKQRHFAYRKKTVDLCGNTILGFQTVPIEILQYLHDWWAHHILKEDMKYKSFVAS